MMKNFFAVLLALGWLASGAHAFCADAKTDLQTIVGKVQAKLKAGKRTAPDLAEDLAAFDAALAAHQGEKTDDVAHLLYMKALLYAEVLEDDAKANEALAKLKTDFPDTADAKKADSTMAALAKQGEARKIQSSLVEGAPFPAFEETDLDGKPLSVESYKGKLVLIDFWATWCGPCVQELPNVLNVYEKHHAEGFEIIGVSLDSDKTKLTTFLKDKNVPWAQYFDGQGWQNKLAAKYGINSIPATYLLGKDGKIIGKGLRGEALESAVTAALAAK